MPPSIVQHHARQTLDRLMTLFPSTGYRVTWWWEGDVLSCRIHNRTTDREYLAAWNQAVNPDHVIRAAQRWHHDGEPAMET